MIQFLHLLYKTIHQDRVSLWPHETDVETQLMSFDLPTVKSNNNNNNNDKVHLTSVSCKQKIVKNLKDSQYENRKG